MLGGGSKVVRSCGEQGEKRKIKYVIKMWNACVCDAREIYVSMGYGSNCAETEGLKVHTQEM